MRRAVVILTIPTLALGSEGTEQTGLLQQLHRGQITNNVGKQQVTYQSRVSSLYESTLKLLRTGATPEVTKFTAATLKELGEDVFPAMDNEHDLALQTLNERKDAVQDEVDKCKDEYDKLVFDPQLLAADTQAHHVCRDEQLEVCNNCTTCEKICKDKQVECDEVEERCHKISLPPQCNEDPGSCSTCPSEGGAADECGATCAGTQTLEAEIQQRLYGPQGTYDATGLLPMTMKESCTWSADRWVTDYITICEKHFRKKEECKECHETCARTCAQEAPKKKECNDKWNSIVQGACIEVADHSETVDTCKHQHGKAKKSFHDHMWGDPDKTPPAPNASIAKGAADRKGWCKTLEGVQCLLSKVKPGPCNKNGTEEEDCKNFDTSNCSRYDIDPPPIPEPPQPPSPPADCSDPEFMKTHKYDEYKKCEAPTCPLDENGDVKDCFKITECKCAAEPPVPPPITTAVPSPIVDPPVTTPPIVCDVPDCSKKTCPKKGYQTPTAVLKKQPGEPCEVCVCP